MILSLTLTLVGLNWVSILVGVYCIVFSNRFSSYQVIGRRKLLVVLYEFDDEVVEGDNASAINFESAIV